MRILVDKSGNAEIEEEYEEADLPSPLASPKFSDSSDIVEPVKVETGVTNSLKLAFGQLGIG